MKGYLWHEVRKPFWSQFILLCLRLGHVFNGGKIRPKRMWLIFGMENVHMYIFICLDFLFIYSKCCLLQLHWQCILKTYKCALTVLLNKEDMKTVLTANFGHYNKCDIMKCITTQKFPQWFKTLTCFQMYFNQWAVTS